MPVGACRKARVFAGTCRRQNRRSEQPASQAPRKPLLARARACAMGRRPNQGVGLEARKNWVHNFDHAPTHQTPILSTAHAPPKGPMSGAHAHGTRSGASREVCARDSSPVGGRHYAPETTQKGSEQNFVRALRAPNRGLS